MFRLRAKAKGLALVFERTPDVPQYVRLDENKLRQVLINLLSNAVKFTKVGSIMLRVGSKEYEVRSREAALLHFEVEDTGIGIAPEELDSVFDTFVQTASGRQSYQGTGLGMPISRRFVRMMGGDITVSSELGKGTTFKFDVPVRLADPDKVQAAYPTRRVISLEPGQHAADGGPYRLLVAEDKAVNRALLLKLLKPLGFDVREAVNGQEAVEIWEEWHPHLIWMDMRMPVLDGYEATKHIKSRIENRKPKVETVIIALTASAFEEDRATALASGCDDFVRKPFREIELFDTLAKHLGVRFVYEEAGKQVEKGTERTSPTERLSVTALAAMPSGWLTDMYQATLEGDLSWMATLVEQIQDANLADTLSELINDFEHDMILDLIRLAQA
jgi:CheY-like chemotaxis protein